MRVRERWGTHNHLEAPEGRGLRKVQRMRVGLTGGVASGKSTVAAILRELGAVVVDSDALAREVVEPGTPGLESVVAEFGPGVLGDDGSLDRAELGRLVF